MKKRLALLVAGLVIGFLVGSYQRVSDQSDFYITAAHIPHNQIEGYTFMYEDTEKDTAYYLKEDIKHRLPRFDTKVKFVNNAGIVEGYISDYGFIVNVNNKSDVYKGMSGARVTDMYGNELGFISSYKDGKLFCISTR